MVGVGYCAIGCRLVAEICTFPFRIELCFCLSAGHLRRTTCCYRLCRFDRFACTKCLHAKIAFSVGESRTHVADNLYYAICPGNLDFLFLWIRSLWTRGLADRNLDRSRNIRRASDFCGALVRKAPARTTCNYLEIMDIWK